MKKSRLMIWASWRRLSFGVLVIVSALLALLLHLGSLAPSLSPTEKATLGSSSSIHAILTNPLQAPLKLMEWLTTLSPHSSLILDRLPSVGLALLSLGLFVYVLRHWYGPRSMVIGFIIMVTSAWFLHIGRFAGVDMEYFAGILSLLAVHVGLYDHDNRKFMIYLWLLTNLVLLFIPGFIWFILLSLVWQRAELVIAWQKLTPVLNRLGWLLLGAVGLAALVWSLIRTPHLILTWLGMPQHFADWPNILRQLVNTLSAFVYHGPRDPELWLGHLPLLNIFLIVMLLAGLAFYTKHWQAIRTRMVASYCLLGVILVSLGGPVNLSVIVPIVYLVIVAGIAYILHFWLSVYPRNPLARGFGFALLSLVIALSCFYGLQQYFIAWPNNPQTVAIYRNSP